MTNHSGSQSSPQRVKLALRGSMDEKLIGGARLRIRTNILLDKKPRSLEIRYGPGGTTTLRGGSASNFFKGNEIWMRKTRLESAKLWVSG
jgi:hypothetical protein